VRIPPPGSVTTTAGGWPGVGGWLAEVGRAGGGGKHAWPWRLCSLGRDCDHIRRRCVAHGAAPGVRDLGEGRPIRTVYHSPEGWVIVPMSVLIGPPGTAKTSAAYGWAVPARCRSLILHSMVRTKQMGLVMCGPIGHGSFAGTVDARRGSIDG
jgi:hypothetical protein